MTPRSTLASWGPSATHAPLTYPGRIPEHSFVVNGPNVVAVTAERTAIDEALRPGVSLRGRTPVLAVGSNAAPARLAEKGRGRPVAAIRVTVHDHSVVYSAHVARYGSIAATLYPDPGATCRLHVTCFDDEQLASVDRSEGNYAREPLRGLVEGVRGLLDTAVQRYRSRWGALQIGGRVVRLAEVESEGSALPEMAQPAVQARVADHVRAAGGAGSEHGATPAEMVRSGGVRSGAITALIAAGLA